MEQRQKPGTDDPLRWLYPAALADMDGDGRLEAMINTCNQRFVAQIRMDGLTILASDPVPITSGYGAPENGSTAFDFRGHGPDWLAHDAGIGEQELAKFSDSFAQIVAVPVVADVDNDGSADIVMIDESGSYVLVYEDYLRRPSPARRIWNKWNYQASTVREDATIPSVVATHSESAGIRTQTRRSCYTPVPAR